MGVQRVSNRTLSVCAFSLLFAYVLSFLFEGRVLYGLLDAGGADASPFVFAAIIAHFLGQFSCGFFCHAEAIISAYKDTSLATVTNTVTANFTKADGKWTIDNPGDLFEALG